MSLSDDLAGWLADLGPQRLTGPLTQHKALVFRGFRITAESVEPVLDQLVPGRLPYVHGNSPPTRCAAISTPPPSIRSNSPSRCTTSSITPAAGPTGLAFFCERAAESGGATPVLHGQLWLASLDTEVRDAFAGGVRYVQNLHDGYGLGKSWQDTFETDDRASVEEFLADAEAQWE
jgi:hypothetical protein